MTVENTGMTAATEKIFIDKALVSGYIPFSLKGIDVLFYNNVVLREDFLSARWRFL